MVFDQKQKQAKEAYEKGKDTAEKLLHKGKETKDKIETEYQDMVNFASGLIFSVQAPGLPDAPVMQVMASAPSMPSTDDARDAAEAALARAKTSGSAAWEAVKGQEREKLDMTEVGTLQETCWLCYFCCAGFGCGKFGEPTVGCESQCCCPFASCTSADCKTNYDGMISTVCSCCCCCTCHASLPPAGGAPITACCCCQCCKSCKKDPVLAKDALFDYMSLMTHTGWCLYCCCTGCGCNIPCDGRPGCGYSYKGLCSRCQCSCGLPINEEASCCFCLATCTKLWSHCSFPPKCMTGPFFALLGCRWACCCRCGFGPAKPKEDEVVALVEEEEEE